VGINNEPYAGVSIFLHIPQASCDLCFKQFKTQRLMAGVPVTIELKDPPEWFSGQGQIYIVPGYGYNALAAELNKTGWTSEVFHGKQFIICPSCSKKPTVERSETDLQTQAE
jgi:hypothetical protein